MICRLLEEIFMSGTSGIMAMIGAMLSSGHVKPKWINDPSSVSVKKPSRFYPYSSDRQNDRNRKKLYMKTVNGFQIIQQRTTRQAESIFL
jgi:hypothetical protein